MTTKETKQLNKVVRLGTMKPSWSNKGYSIYCKIELKDGRLSISGVEGPHPSGNCRGACGQIDMHLKDEYKQIVPAKGWNHSLIKKFLDVWDRWHLNDMRAGSPKQEQFKLNNPETRSYDYAQLKGALVRAGLEPDNGYSYGSAWLSEEIPQEVIDFLESLPDTDKEPAWV